MSVSRSYIYVLSVPRKLALIFSKVRQLFVSITLLDKASCSQPFILLALFCSYALFTGSFIMTQTTLTDLELPEPTIGGTGFCPSVTGTGFPVLDPLGQLVVFPSFNFIGGARYRVRREGKCPGYRDGSPRPVR